MTGTRAAETFIYGYNKYPYNLIGPATVLWHAVSADGPPAIQRGGDKGKGKSKGKGKEKETATNPQQRIRTVWVRVHPSVTEEVHDALRMSASFTLDGAKQTGRVAEVEMADLREQFNVFEVMGPKSSQVIKGALRPVADQRADFNQVCLKGLPRVFGALYDLPSSQFWKSLSSLQSSGSVARGMVIGFTVYDPRLR